MFIVLSRLYRVRFSCITGGKLLPNFNIALISLIPQIYKYNGKKYCLMNSTSSNFSLPDILEDYAVIADVRRPLGIFFLNCFLCFTYATHKFPVEQHDSTLTFHLSVINVLY